MAAAGLTQATQTLAKLLLEVGEEREEELHPSSRFLNSYRYLTEAEHNRKLAGQGAQEEN